MSKFPPRQPPDTRLSDLLRKMGLDPNNVQVITASEFDRTDNVIPFPKSGSAQKQGVPVNAARVSFPNFPKRSTLSPSDHILNVLGLLAAADKEVRTCNLDAAVVLLLDMENPDGTLTIMHSGLSKYEVLGVLDHANHECMLRDETDPNAVPDGAA